MMQSLLDAFNAVAIAAASGDSEAVKRALGTLIHAAHCWLDELAK